MIYPSLVIYLYFTTRPFDTVCQLSALLLYHCFFLLNLCVFSHSGLGLRLIALVGLGTMISVLTCFLGLGRS